jgi:YD repeat-containing protein
MRLRQNGRSRVKSSFVSELRKMSVRLYFASILVLVASPAWLARAQQSSQTGVFMSDRDKAGLRGPVKTVLNEQTFSGADGQRFLTSTTTEYAPDGRILELRIGNSDGSIWVTSYTYYADGRLLKTVSGRVGSAANSQTTYLYDDARRLVSVESGDSDKLTYQYDEKGRKSIIESYGSRSLPPNTAYAPHWEGTDLGFAPYPGGTLTTSYNEQGVATGAELHDAEGTLVGHIVRKFDAQGRIIAEEQAADAPQVNLPEEFQSNLNPEQMKSVGAMIAGMQNSVISYSYDAQGRVTERHRSGGVFGEQVTVTTYNDHGDKVSERETTVMRADTGPWSLTEAGAFVPAGKPNPPQPPLSSETQYAYQYDQYGNWTEQTIVSRSQQDEAFRPGTVIRRKLTYY